MNSKKLFVILCILAFTIALSGQNFSKGDPVLVKLHDYHVGKIVEKSGDKYRVDIYAQTGDYPLVSTSLLIPLKKTWVIGDWILTDWTNERVFIKAQIVYVEAGRYLCVDWPRQDMLWREYTTLVPLEYIAVLGHHFNSDRNYYKPETSIIASDLYSQERQSAIETVKNSDNELKVSDAVEVEWNGTWYAAKILKQKDNKYYISYNGYDSSWNEWVGNERIRSAHAPKGTAPEIGTGNSIQWKIGDIAWNTFTNEGKYFQVKLLASDSGVWLCMELKSMAVDWKKPEDLHVEKPVQTFFPGK